MSITANIKICGLRRKEDAIIVNEFEEIKYVGFVFAKSKRQVDIETAKIIKANLRKDIKCVGVFTDTDIEKVNEIAQRAEIDIIQLHSDETKEMCKKANREVWKHISIKDENSILKAKEYENIINGFLLDTFSKDLRGGTGEKFNWEYVKDFSKSHFTILAGGISKENIIEADRAVKPNIIDLSSSVETDGYKDYDKVFELIRRIRNER